MNRADLMAERFEDHRGHLRGVAFRMLGSLTEADDAVQEAWLRLSSSDTDSVNNLGGWLTTVVARVCLDMLRARRARKEDSLELQIRQPGKQLANGHDPEQEAVMTDSVGLALLIVLESLSPTERLAFVLHDIFAMPFEEIAPIVGRTPVAAKKLASRARHRVQGSQPADCVDRARQRAIVEAFLVASRSGDLRTLIALLDPNVVRRADPEALSPGGNVEVRGADKVATEILTNTGLARFAHLALVNGNVGLIVAVHHQLHLALSLEFSDGRIVEIDVIANPTRLRGTDVRVL